MSFVKKMEKTIQIVWYLTEKKKTDFWGISASVRAMTFMSSYSMGTQVFMIKIWKEYFLVNLRY
jgi:hypothetical protein